MRREAGFTMIEIMVSMTLLVVGLLGILALHATTVKGNRVSRQMERARVMATQLMEDVRGKDLTPFTSNASVVLPDVTASDGVIYHRRYNVDSSGSLKMVTVTVTFADDENSADTHAATLQMLRTAQEIL